MLPSAYTYTNADDQARALSPYPDTEEGWRARYTALGLAYEQGAYSTAEVQAYHLFRAVNDAGDEIDMTRRVAQVYRFIVDTDTRGFLGSGLTPEERHGSAVADLEKAEEIWRRSQMPEFLSKDIRALAALGDYWYEAVLDPSGKARLIAYDPRMVTAYYSPVDGRTLERVVFSTQTLEEPRRSGFGLTEDDLIRTWKREVTPFRITEWVNGVETKSYAHPIGVVPAVQLRWTPWEAPEHSLPAPHGVEHAVTRIDSFFTQGAAIANRHAHPTLAIFGARIGSGATNVSLGRVLSGLPVDGDAKYLEMSGAGLGEIRQVIGDIMAHVRETAPEFLFADSGANESGTARSYRASAFVMKIEEARQHNLAALARVLGMAVAREQRRAYDIGEDRIVLQAPPVIAPHVPTELAAVKTLVDLGAITRADVVRHAQRLGLVDRSVDPVLYANEAQDERAATATAFFNDPAGTQGSAETPDAPGDNGNGDNGNGA